MDKTLKLDVNNLEILANGDIELHREIKGLLTKLGYRYNINTDRWIKNAEIPSRPQDGSGNSH